MKFKVGDIITDGNLIHVITDNDGVDYCGLCLLNKTPVRDYKSGWEWVTEVNCASWNSWSKVENKWTRLLNESR